MFILTKKCSRCKTEKVISEFHKNKYQCKECRREEKKVYREKNREKVLQDHRRYNNEHREELRLKNKIAKLLKRLQKPPRVIIGRSESSRKYRVNHREKYNAYARNRKAIIRGGVGKLTDAEWQEVLEKYGNKCLRCGSTENLTRDHVVPVSEGGTNTKDNIQPLCANCNSKKHTKIIDYR